MALTLIAGGLSDELAFPLFNSILDRTGRRQLRRQVTLVSAARGEIIGRQGEVNRDLFVVAAGVIKLCKTLPDGRQLIVAFRTAGDPVSLQRGDTPWPVTAQAVSECVLFRIDWESLALLSSRFPAIDGALLDLAYDDIAGLQNRLLLLGCQTTEEKVASFILDFSHSTRSPSSLGREIHLPMRRSEIAEYLALTTESVSRAFSRFRRERMIAMRRPSRIVVLNRPALEAIALGEDGVLEDLGTRSGALEVLESV